MLQGKIAGNIGIMLALLKLFFGAAVIMLLAQENAEGAALFILFLMLADIFDGILFRRSPHNASQRLAKMFRAADVLGDIVVVNTVLIAMMLWYRFPLGLYAITIVRTLLSGTLLAYGRAVHKMPWRGNLSSRLAGLFTGLMAVAWLLGKTNLSLAFAGLLIIFGITGLLGHYKNLRPRKKVSANAAR